ncbi:MAG: copper amine oxidase N-terminal domain-containing protein, partial [Peptostreptococcaceae bacterium]|nr:copper amine oxidase N-terminal domain-containing protein [Peptostreptococcaceae bacterium]
TFEILNFGDHASFKMDSTSKKVLVNTKLAEAKEYQIKVKAMASGYTAKEFTEEGQIIKITVAPADPKTFGDLSAQVEQGLKVGNENVNADATVVTLSVKDNGNTQAVADATFEILNFGDHASFKMDSTSKKVLVNTKLAEAKEYQIKVKAMASGYTAKEFTEEGQIIKITVAPADPVTLTDQIVLQMPKDLINNLELDAEQAKNAGFSLSGVGDDVRIERITTENGNKILITLNKQVKVNSNITLTYDPKPNSPVKYLGDKLAEGSRFSGKIQNAQGAQKPFKATLVLDAKEKLSAQGTNDELFTIVSPDELKDADITFVSIQGGSTQIVLTLGNDTAFTDRQDVTVEYHENVQYSNSIRKESKSVKGFVIENVKLGASAENVIEAPQDPMPQPQDPQPAPPASSGGSSYSSVRPGADKKADNKAEDKKDIKKVDEMPEIKPDSKVSTKLTIGDMKYTVVVDGQEVERTMDVTPMIHMGRTVLPARMISEILGVEVKYEPMTKTANFMYGEAKVQLTLGQKFMMVNGKSMPLTADILNVNGRILLPLTDIQKAFAELGLKANVDWDAETKSVTVNK